MYKINDKIKTIRGTAFVIATKDEAHIINGSHPFLGIGDKLFPAKLKDYVIAFENTDKRSSFDFIYEDHTHTSLTQLINE